MYFSKEWRVVSCILETVRLINRYISWRCRGRKAVRTPVYLHNPSPGARRHKSVKHSFTWPQSWEVYTAAILTFCEF